MPNICVIYCFHQYFADHTASVILSVLRVGGDSEAQAAASYTEQTSTGKKKTSFEAI